MASMTLSPSKNLDKVDDVIDSFSQLIQWGEKEGSSLAYFPVCYQQLFMGIQGLLKQGSFKNEELAELVTIRVAKDFLDSFQKFEGGLSAALCWEEVFQATLSGNHSVIQSILFGVSVAIYHDWPVALAELCPGDSVQKMKPDFFKIMRMWSEKWKLLERVILDISPLSRVFQYMPGKPKYGVIHFSFATATRASWDSAKNLAVLSPKRMQAEASDIQQSTKHLRKSVLGESFWMRRVCDIVHMAEEKDVKTVIECLKR